jgi:hypothetical protein
MSSTRQNAMRNVAEAEIDRRLGKMHPRHRQELATSLVRQWITNDGYGGILTPSAYLWFHMVRPETGGFDVGFEAQAPRFLDRLREWQVPEESVPELLHQLNIRQNASCVSQDGRHLRLRMLPKEGMLLVAPMADEDA